jgi:hypothetical protein
VTRAAGEERRGGGKWREEGEGEGGFGKVVKVGRIYDTMIRKIIYGMVLTIKLSHYI